MSTDNETTKLILESLIEQLDIPPGYYEKAVERYESIAKYFHRNGSTIGELDPSVYSQGSFRLGTVIRPVEPKSGYDLDLVCRVQLNKENLTQAELKALIGKEVKSYAESVPLKEKPTEGDRCWKLQYQDDVDFHMDILPCIPNDESVQQLLKEAGVNENHAREALAITDREHENYAVKSANWPRSNPRGFALWFEERMDIGGLAKQARQLILEKGGRTKYASIDDVPAYQLKTPLQRAVQLLKRHRDFIFRNDLDDNKPASIILTTLASRAYDGQADIVEALSAILQDMGNHVGNQKPRIPNPADKTEDFTDRWNQAKEREFWRWLRQAQEDFEFLMEPASSKSLLQEHIQNSFGLSLPMSLLESLTFASAGPNIVTSVSKESPRPWTKIT